MDRGLWLALSYGQSRHLVPVSVGELPGRDETVCSASIVVMLTPRRCRLRLYGRWIFKRL